MTDQRRMTLKDLAQELNVSTATISNAFNRPDQLSPALRERILKEAKRLGYSGPDAKARSLRTGRSRIIAVILAESLTYSLNDAVASEFLSGLPKFLMPTATRCCYCRVAAMPHSRRAPPISPMALSFMD
ncbi:LacI family DNA-binding transcriptional regulator [Halomonas sp. PA16-9]|uniref:LacI family DNA-binding transcriptional regulator n=1 Tax=Halomonas sp. PA16-9 TaxID=2576841 RepID=UPI0030EC2063